MSMPDSRLRDYLYSALILNSVRVPCTTAEVRGPIQTNAQRTGIQAASRNEGTRLT